MGLLTPLNLLALLGVPIIFILYMLRPKNTPVKIPSIYLWKQVEKELESASRIQKLRSSILMFLQILAVILIALLLAGIYYLTQVTTEHSIIIIDNTITMQATDVAPNRFESAKTQVYAYMDQLPAGQRVTLIELTDAPNILIKESTDHDVIMGMVSDLTTSGLSGNYDLLMDMLSVYDYGEIVYFGDKALAGATNFKIGGALENAGITNLSYTISEGQISVLSDIYGVPGTDVQLSLYGDEALLDTISVSIGDDGMGKGFFSAMPNVFSMMQAKVDEVDALAVDNEAFLILSAQDIKKVALITDANTFLDKLLGLYNMLEVYKVQQDDRLDVSGFDWYIYDGFIPETLPVDGLVMIFNPEGMLDFQSLGYVNTPDYMYMTHPLTTHLTEGDYVIGLSHVYETPVWADAFMTCEAGTIAFAGVYEGRDLIVIGFDIHNTDMPLTASYPIFMNNIIEYNLNQKQVDANGHQMGDTIELHLSASTERAFVTNPIGHTSDIDLRASTYQFTDTVLTGVYTLTTETAKGTKVEQFAVNGSVDTSGFSGEIDAGDSAETLTSKAALSMMLGVLLLTVLCVEWLIYGLRRRKR